MKFAIFLFTILLCLLVGTLARPDPPVDENLVDPDDSSSKSPSEGERTKRDTEVDSNSNGTPFATVANSLRSIASRTSDLLSQIGKMQGVPAVKELMSSLPDILNGDTTLGDINKMFSAENVDKFLQQLNPLNDLLMNAPWVSEIYETVLKMISIPLSIFANILGTLSFMFGRMISTLSPINTPLLS